MHERLKIADGGGSDTSVEQMALVDDDQGLLFRTRIPPKTSCQLTYWNLRTGQVELDPHGNPKSHPCQCISANGRYHLFRVRKNSAQVWDREAQQIVARIDAAQENCEFQISDDGQTVASFGEKIAIWRAATGKMRNLAAGESSQGRLSPSGKRLLDSPRAGVFDVESGKKQLSLPTDSRFGTISPDSQSFLYTYNYRAKLWNLETGEKKESLVAPFEIIGGAVSLDHTRIAVGGLFEGIRVWEVPSEDILATWQVPDRYIRRLCFNANGSRLITATDDGLFRVWDVAAGKERACLVLLKNDAWVTLTPEGYFLGSDNLADEAQWQIDGKEVPFDRYAKKYHRPKRVAEALCSPT